MAGLASIRLDDRNWQELRDELKRRIPTHSTVWTDHNASDPGIVLIELFAWLGENLLARMNKMPEKAQREFLNLLNIPLQEAQIATAQVKFSSDSPRPVLIPYGKLSEKLRVMSGDLAFQITDELTVLPVEAYPCVKAKVDKNEKFVGVEQVISLIKTKIDLSKDITKENINSYETKFLSEPEAGILPPVTDINNSVDKWLWIALLAPEKLTRGLKGDALSNKLDELRLNCAGNAVSFGFQIDESLCGSIDHQRCTDPEANFPAIPMEWEIATGRYAQENNPSISQIIYLPLKTKSDNTFGMTRSGTLKLRLPRSKPDGSVPFGDWVAGLADPDLAGVGQLPPRIDDEKLARRVLTWVRIRRPQNDLPAIRLHHVAINVVEVEQAITAKSQLLGYGNGQTYQMYHLSHTPVIKDSQLIQVREAGEWKNWYEVDDMNQALPDDRFYTINLINGTVIFGDGVHGRIPRPGEAIRCLSYRYGGGAKGNVPADSLKKVRASGNHLKSLKAINLFVAKGGVDGETDIEALSRIPEYLHHRDRAVAKDDFQKLALETPCTNLGRVEVLPRHKPHERIDEVPGVVTLILIPAYDPLHPNEPIPDKSTINKVCQYLETRRLITTELYLTPAEYIPVYLSSAIEVEEGYGIDTVNSWVELAIRQYFAPLPPYGPAGSGWPFGRAIRTGDIEVAIMRVEGVRLVHDVRLETDITGIVPDKVSLKKWQLPVIKNVQIAAVPFGATDKTPTAPKIEKEEPVTTGDQDLIPVPVEREQC